MKITTTTDYPFGETVRMKLDCAKDVEFPLYVRIPGWCKRADVTVNGDAVSEAPNDKGFVKLGRRWKRGDVVELHFPMRPRIERGFETAYPAATHEYFSFMPAAVFRPRRLPYASVMFGPLLFSLPIPDVDPNTPVKDAKWQYALDAMQPGDMHVERRPMPAHWDWPLDAPIGLTVPARAFDWHPSDAQALPAGPVVGDSSETIRLVPYGCTKFRISMFPVTPKAAGKALP